MYVLKENDNKTESYSDWIKVSKMNWKQKGKYKLCILWLFARKAIHCKRLGEKLNILYNP